VPPLRRLVLPFLLVGGLVGAGVLGVAGPASADVTGSTSTDDVVLYNHCQQHPIDYDLLVSPGTALWRLEVQVADPAGHVSEGSVVNSATNPTTAGTVTTTFCGSEPAGTYTVRATGFYEILPAVEIPYVLPTTTFQVRPAKTRTSLRSTSLGHGRYRLTTTVREESEKGFAKSNGVTVRIERLVHGAWKKVRGTALTTVHGAVTATLTGRAGSKVRAVVPARNNYAGSSSRAVRL
jgi:hypothetical protein